MVASGDVICKIILVYTSCLCHNPSLTLERRKEWFLVAFDQDLDVVLSKSTSSRRRVLVKSPLAR